MELWISFLLVLRCLIYKTFFFPRTSSRIRENKLKHRCTGSANKFYSSLHPASRQNRTAFEMIWKWARIRIARTSRGFIINRRQKRLVVCKSSIYGGGPLIPIVYSVHTRMHLHILVITILILFFRQRLKKNLVIFYNTDKNMI